MFWAVGALVACATVVSAGVALDGIWSGTLYVGFDRTPLAASAALTQRGAAIGGTLAIAGHATVPVDGTIRGGELRLVGATATERVRWRARWVPKRSTWRGRVVMRNAIGKVHGVLGVVRGTGGGDGNGSGNGGGGTGPATCGADFFAAHVMPEVLQPNCALCHVAGGVAQTARLRVTTGDPVGTAATAMLVVDQSTPAQSLLLLKPRAAVAHGGGQRFSSGDASDLTLQHWVELVTAPACVGSGGGGGNGGGGNGGGGGGGSTGDLYTDNCASCHGSDARGLNGQPDIHCNRDIHDVVRNGRSGTIGVMPAFPNLSDTDIATIQAHLGTLCPAGAATGAELFASNCATCHGADAGGVDPAPSVRCATMVADAVQVGRGTRMPAFPSLAGADLSHLEGFLDQLCTEHGRTGADLYAGNCSTCHGATANGGRNGLGVHGPGIRCKDAGEFGEKIRYGEDGMPAFPALDSTDVSAIVDYVHASFCPFP